AGLVPDGPRHGRGAFTTESRGGLRQWSGGRLEILLMGWTRPSRRPGRGRCRPAPESLEARSLLSTFHHPVAHPYPLHPPPPSPPPSPTDTRSPRDPPPRSSRVSRARLHSTPAPAPRGPGRPTGSTARDWPPLSSTRGSTTGTRPSAADSAPARRSTAATTSP